MKRILLTFILFSTIAFCDEILSPLWQKNLNLKKQSIQKSSNVLENSWINPLMLSSSKSKNQNTSKFGDEEILNFKIGLNQDIFRSGGIFYAIKYADASRQLGLDQVASERNSQIIKAYSILIKILKNDKEQMKQSLFIENAILEIKRKKEQYLAGILDVSFLNDAILSKISGENLLLNLKEMKQSLLTEFKNISDKNYKNITLPILKMPKKEEYLANNLNLLVQNGKIKSKEYLAKLSKSQYLPKISINANYINNNIKRDHINTNDDYYSYGIVASMPLDIKTFDDIEKSRLEHLISQNEYEIIRKNKEKEYDKISSDLKRIDEKIRLSEENIKIYESLLKQTKELVDAEIKIKDDLIIMQNSKKIRELELEIQNLEKNEKKLELYKNLIVDF